MYALFSRLVSRVVKACGPALTNQIGLISSSIGYTFIGPVPFLGLHLSAKAYLPVMIMTLACMGLGETFVLIPAVPLMLASIPGASEDTGT